MKAMNFVRKALIVLLAPLLSLLLFATALDFGVVHTAGSPASIKKIIADSDIYKTAVSAALDQAKTASGSGSEVSLTDPAVKATAVTTFTPQFLQTTTENVIDSVYRWLDGKTSVPDFNIDLTPQKTVFGDAIGQTAQSRAATLPRCTSLPRSFSLDVFSATCLPPGVTPTQAGNEAKASILSGKGFLENPVINAASVKGSGSSQSIFTDKLKSVPKHYRLARKTPYILALLAILVGTAIVFLSTSRRRGLRRIGIILAGVGIFMLIFAWALNYGVNQKALPKVKFNNAVMQADLKTLISDVVKAVDKNYWLFGTIYVILGVATIGGPVLIDKCLKPVHAKTGDQTKDADQEPPVGEEPAAKSKKSIKKVKIQ